MSNGARHGLGVVIGVVATPIIAACLMYGTSKLALFTRTFRFDGGDRWIGGAVLLVAALIIGLVAGSRVSPLASLVPGAVFAAVGTLWIVSPRWVLSNLDGDVLPRDLETGYGYLAPIGVFLVIGFGLLAASVAPSRWKARSAAGAASRYGGPPPAPMGPPPAHGAVAPMGAPQAPSAPGQSPPWGAPQYGQPPAQPAQPAQPGMSNPPPLPSASPAPPSDDRPAPSSRSGPDEDEPGDWTRMYGGNRPT